MEKKDNVRTESEKISLIVKILGACVAAMFVCLVIIVLQLSVMNHNMEILRDETGAGNIKVEDLKQPVGTEITNKQEKAEILQLIGTATLDLKKSNSYIQCIDHEDKTKYTTLIYNKKGESIAQTAEGQITIYMDDNNTVYFGDEVSYGMNADIVGQMYCAYQLANEGFAKVTKAKLPDGADTDKKDDNVVQYVIDVEGWGNIQKMFEHIESKFAIDMVNSIKGNLTEAGFTEAETSNLNMRFAYVFDGDKLVGGGNYLYFGKNQSGYWSNCTPSWYFDGYFEVGDWTLGDKWYNYDYSKLATTDNNEISGMLESLYLEVSDMLAPFKGEAPDNGETPDTHSEADHVEPKGNTSSGAGDTNPKGDTDK